LLAVLGLEVVQKKHGVKNGKQCIKVLDTALCNRVGIEDNLHFSGESFVCNPNGKLIAQAGSMTEEILYCDIDLNEVYNSSARKLFLPDRRAELYKNLI